MNYLKNNSWCYKSKCIFTNTWMTNYRNFFKSCCVLICQTRWFYEEKFICPMWLMIVSMCHEYICVWKYTWWNGSADLLWCRVYVPNKWHFLYKPFSNPKDGWTHPWGNKYSNQKNEYQRSQKTKTCSVPTIISTCHKHKMDLVVKRNNIRHTIQL